MYRRLACIAAQRPLRKLTCTNKLDGDLLYQQQGAGFSRSQR